MAHSRSPQHLPAWSSSAFRTAFCEVRLLAVALLVLLMGTAAPGAASADAPGCATPASTLDYHVVAGTVYGSGLGRFTCTGPVDSVQYRVSVSYRVGPAAEYSELTASTDWVPVGNFPGPGTAEFSLHSRESATICGQYLVRPMIRWKYRGASSFTTSDNPQNITPPCA
jgi:hypothetical protein